MIPGLFDITYDSGLIVALLANYLTFGHAQALPKAIF
jgi:hypothetical protein